MLIENLLLLGRCSLHLSLLKRLYMTTLASTAPATISRFLSHSSILFLLSTFTKVALSTQHAVEKSVSHVSSCFIVASSMRWTIPGTWLARKYFWVKKWIMISPQLPKLQTITSPPQTLSLIIKSSRMQLVPTIASTPTLWIYLHLSFSETTLESLCVSWFRLSFCTFLMVTLSWTWHNNIFNVFFSRQ